MNSDHGEDSDALQRLRDTVKALTAENRRLKRDNAALRADCEEMKDALFRDTDTIRDLDQQCRQLRETLEEERRVAGLATQDAVAASVKSVRAQYEVDMETLHKSQERERHMFQLRQNEMRARYESQLSSPATRRLSAASLHSNRTSPGITPLPVSPPTANRAAWRSPTSFSFQSPTVAQPGRSTDLPGDSFVLGRSPAPPHHAPLFSLPEAPANVYRGMRKPHQQQQQRDVAAQLSSFMEHPDGNEGKKREMDTSHVLDRLGAVGDSFHLNTVAGLYEFWMKLGGAAGWKQTISERALRSLIRRSAVTDAWLAPPDTEGWCGQITTRVAGQEMKGFVSVVLAQLPNLVTLAVHAAPEWVFDWELVTQEPGEAFPSLRQVLLSRIRWAEAHVHELGRNLEALKREAFLEDIVLDKSTAMSGVNYGRLRRSSCVLVSYFTKPITEPLRECVPRLVWKKLEAEGYISPASTTEGTPADGDFFKQRRGTAVFAVAGVESPAEQH